MCAAPEISIPKRQEQSAPSPEVSLRKSVPPLDAMLGMGEGQGGKWEPPAFSRRHGWGKSEVGGGRG